MNTLLYQRERAYLFKETNCVNEVADGVEHISARLQVRVGSLEVVIPHRPHNVNCNLSQFVLFQASSINLTAEIESVTFYL